MLDNNPTISTITLKVHGLNAPNERQSLSEQIKKQDPAICCLQETHFKYKDSYKLEVNGWRKIYHVNTNQNKMRIAILISIKASSKQ